MAGSDAVWDERAPEDAVKKGSMHMKRLIALALAMMMIASSALAWGEKSGAELYGEAETLLKQGKYDEAAEAFSALGNYQDAS